MTLVAPRKPTSSHRQRTGQHQHRHKHFSKTYWPYLPMLLIVGLGLMLNNHWPAQQHQVLGASTNLSSASLLELTNTARDKDHEQPLVANNRLNAAAQAKANDMAQRNYWSHTTPDGQAPWNFLTSAGYSYQLAGENLAYGFSTADSTLKAWLNSPEHRVNILNASYQQIGFGLASSPDFKGSGPATIIVALYAKPASSSKTTLTSSTVTNTPGHIAHDTDGTSQPVARIQVLTGGRAPWSLFAVSLLACLAITIMLIKHGRHWHKALVKSEAFVIDHPLLDIVIVGIATFSFLLGQAAGFVK